jgi:CRISPR-associated endonuclease Cas2
MRRRQPTLAYTILHNLLASKNIHTPWKSKLILDQAAHLKNPKSIETTLYRLRNRGLIKIVDSDNERFVELTKEGQLEALISKAIIPPKGKWDGKWRIIMFDIPEECKEKRHELRWLLKKNHYHQLQASVYINPYPLNREAITFLQETNLMRYIRIVKIEEMDNDTELRKRFHL